MVNESALLAPQEEMNDIELAAMRAQELEDSFIEDSFPKGFSFEDGWLVFQRASKKVKDGASSPPSFLPICSRLEVIGHTRDKNNENHGRLLKFKDDDGYEHLWSMPMDWLAGDGKEVRGVLLNKGLQISSCREAKNKILEYIQKCNPVDRVRCVSQIGWYGQSFVLPELSVYLASFVAEKIILQSNTHFSNHFSRKGNLKEWQKIADLCSGNTRLTFAVSLAFAPPLLHLLDEENGGFHFRGKSSTGKTTTLYVAASVWGEKSYIQNWRATVNGLEGVASNFNDTLLCLDEIGQIDSSEIGDAAYTLANGIGKSRGHKRGGLQNRAKWRLLFLSTGEISLSDHMELSKKKSRAGHEMRVLDIPVDICTYGCFGNIHDCKDGEEFVNLLGELCRKNYGIAGVKFLENLINYQKESKLRVESLIQESTDMYLPERSSSQVKRAFRRFALVAAAGELATSFGVTNWEQGEATTSEMQCFQDWLSSRGTKGIQEEMSILSQVRHFFELHGESRFSPWSSVEDIENAKTFNRVGYKRSEDAETFFYVFPEAFKREVSEGFDAAAVAKVCQKYGFLDSDGSSATKSVRLPQAKRTQRVYLFVASKIFELKEESC